MRLSIQANGVDVSEQLSEQIKTKVGKLEHYYENIVDAVIYLHEGITHKEIEIKLIVRNDTLFVRESGESFQAAVDVAVDTMKRQIKKYKETTLQK
ncbi:MAG: ribosome-associated translation inhibitor RaiA [Chitinophagaceae bacterium]|nr:MAG: ribosome-associated translation inhibitor RaiA [Chitinophagaceae bacterium]